MNGAHDSGALAGDTIAGVACNSCPRIWQRVSGWWQIPQPTVARRPIETLRHGREASARRERAKPLNLRQQWAQRREDAKR